VGSVLFQSSRWDSIDLPQRPLLKVLNVITASNDASSAPPDAIITVCVYGVVDLEQVFRWCASGGATGEGVIEGSPKQRVMGRIFLLGNPNERWDGRTESVGKMGERFQEVEADHDCLHEACHDENGRPSLLGSPQPARHTVFSQLPRFPTMDTKSQRPRRRDDALSSLNAAIDGLDLAKEIASITPVKAVFGSVSVLLTMVRVRFFLFCGDGPQVHMYPGFDD